MVTDEDYEDLRVLILAVSGTIIGITVVLLFCLLVGIL